MEIPELGETKDGRPIAAWLLKGNPEKWDIHAWFAEHDVVDDWRLNDSYRVGLMRPGDLCFLWLTGPEKKGHVAGVWAAGRVTGWPFESTGGGDLWLDEGEKVKVKPFIPVHLVKLPSPISRAELKDHPEWREAEPLVSPQASNPNVLRQGEVEVLLREMPEPDAWFAEIPEATDSAEIEGGLRQALAEALGESWRLTLGIRDEEEELVGFRALQEVSSTAVDRVVWIGHDADGYVEASALAVDQASKGSGPEAALVVVAEDDEDPESFWISEPIDPWRPDPEDWDPPQE